MGWFEENGFIDRTTPPERTTDQNAPVNTTQPVADPNTPLTAGVPEGAGMTAGDLQARMNDPNNARMSASGQGGGGQEPFNENAFFDMMEQYPPTNEGMRAFYAAAQQRWGAQNVPELLEHPQRLDKFRFADGRTFDVIGGAGGPNPSWVRNLEGPGHGGATGQLGAMMGGNWQAGMDPSYGFRFAEGQKALERSAASKGTLLTGGTLKALAAYGQGLASTEFGNIFNRNYQLAGLGLNAAQSAAGAGSSYGGSIGNLAGNQAQDTANLTTGAGNALAGGTAANAGIWGNTIGGLGQILGPEVPEGGWLGQRGGKDPDYGPRMRYGRGMPTGPAVAGVGPGTFPGWNTQNANEYGDYGG
jgi:hypothetical protein